MLSSAVVAVDETNAALTTGGTLTISDVDSAETFVAQTDVAGRNGKFSIDAAGAWTYTANEAFDSLNVGDSVYRHLRGGVRRRHQDFGQGHDNGTNDAAVLSSAVVALAETNAALATGGTLTISDVDSAETFVAKTDVAGANGKFSIDAAGAWTYTANEAFDSLNVGDSVSDTFEVESADGTNTSVKVTINGTADGPLAAPTSIREPATPSITTPRQSQTSRGQCKT